MQPAKRLGIPAASFPITLEEFPGPFSSGDDVCLENEYLECVEIHEHVVLSLRCIVLAHTKRRGRVIIESGVLIGPLAVVVCPAGKVLRIGEGAVISAGAIIMSSVPPHTIMAPPRAVAVGRSTVPYWKTSIEEFLGGLEPIRRSSSSTNAGTTPANLSPSLVPNTPGNSSK